MRWWDACVQAKLRWALEPVLATLVKDTQMTSKLFLKIPTSSSSKKLHDNCFLQEAQSCLQSLKKPRCVKRTETHRAGFADDRTSLFLLLLGQVFKPQQWSGTFLDRQFETPCTGADECALCQGTTCTRAALQCWGWRLSTPPRGKFTQLGIKFVQ